MNVRILPDHITNPFDRLSDAPMLWTILAIVAGVAVVTVVLIVVLKRKKGGK